MLIFQKKPMDQKPNLQYDRLMQFAEGVTTQRPDSDLRDVLKAIKRYMSTMMPNSGFKPVKGDNEIIIYSIQTREKLANITYTNLN